MKRFTINEHQANVLIEKLFEIYERKYNIKIERTRQEKNVSEDTQTKQ